MYGDAAGYFVGSFVGVTNKGRVEYLGYVVLVGVTERDGVGVGRLLVRYCT